jgi:hypothetical protein
MAYDNNISPGNPPLIWSDVRKAFDAINNNFSIIGASIARTTPKNIAHIEQSDPVRVVLTVAHEYADGTQVSINNSGVSQLDGNLYYIKNSSTNEFTLYSDETLTTTVNGAAYDAYPSGGGTVQAVMDYAQLDFTTFSSDLIPRYDTQYNLGDADNRWGQLHIGSSSYGETYFNGLYLGGAHIRGENDVVILPPGSLIQPIETESDPVPILDNNKTFFKEVQVDNDLAVVADEFVDSLNLISGTAIRMTVSSGAESITIDNIGVTRLTGSTGIAVSANTGNITLSNTGVTSIGNGTAKPSASLPDGAGIAKTSSTGAVTLTNTGVIDIDAGSGITVSRDDATGIVTVTNGAPAQVAFRSFYVDGTNPATDTIVADSTADTLTLVEGYGIIMTTTPSTDTLEITLDQNVDIIGSVFANDSSLMVDAIDNAVYANKVDTPYITGSVLQIDSSAGITMDATTTASLQSDGNFNISSSSANVILTGTRIDLDSPVRAVLGITGDLVGSVFGDDSTKIVDAVENSIEAAGGITGDLTGNVTGNLTGNVTGNLTGNVTGNLTGNVTGNVTGDLTGTVVGDDSTILVDAVDSKLVGPVESSNIVGNGTAKFTVTNVPASSVGAAGDETGMIAFDATSVYYCIADYDSTSNIWVKQDWTDTGAW